ncbi:MAG: ATP-binding protein, partial [Bacteroidota bacterium]|nr:ATP-binding protein [Bacteroidota bacterium]
EISAVLSEFHGKPAIEVIVVDITERKTKDEKLREQANLLDQAHDSIIVRDLDDAVLYINKATEEMYGWSFDEVKGKDIKPFVYDEKTMGQFLSAKAITVEKGEWIGEIIHRTKSGKELTLNSRWALMRDDKGMPRSILVINTDITENKMMEKQVLRMQRMESIGMLAGGIAHDLNNVLGPVLLSIEVLSKKLTDKQSEMIFNALRSSVKRGAEIVKQVLTFSRGLKSDILPIKVKHLTNEIESIVRETFPRSIRVDSDIPKTLWSIMGNPTQLHQVLLNLVVNARDAMPDGGVITMRADNVVYDKLDMHSHPDCRLGKYVVLEIKDTGMGIPKDITEKIFDPFFTTKEQEKGTGLGLSTARSIIKSHGGFIAVQSVEGAGTTFTIAIPALEQEITADGNLPPKNIHHGNGELVLVVDDELSILQITQETLEAFGYTVITARDGTEAIAQYVQHQHLCTAVITDIMMPVMDGIATARALLKIEPKVKIIVTSGMDVQRQIIELKMLGIESFLDKPFSAEQLLAMLYDLLHGDVKTAS